MKKETKIIFNSLLLRKSEKWRQTGREECLNIMLIVWSLGHPNSSKNSSSGYLKANNLNKRNTVSITI